MLLRRTESSETEVFEYIDEPLMARSTLEDEIKVHRRSVYNLVRAAHILDVPYWVAYRIQPKDVIYIPDMKEYEVIITDAAKCLDKIVRISEDHYRPLKAWLKIQKKQNIYSVLTLIRACMDKLGIWYDTSSKRVRGFKYATIVDSNKGIEGFNGD